MRLESGDRFEINGLPVEERLTEPFEISDSVVIPPGEYHWMRYRLEAGFTPNAGFPYAVTRPHTYPDNVSHDVSNDHGKAPQASAPDRTQRLLF